MLLRQPPFRRRRPDVFCAAECGQGPDHADAGERADVAEVQQASQYVSNPADPVPYRAREDIRHQFTPREYMTDDQRFLAGRPDVLTFQTEVLDRDVTIAGSISGNLFISTDQTDADWIVKVIDVFPNDHPQLEGTPDGIRLAGYQMLVRGDVLRSRFRDSVSDPKPLVAGEVTPVKVPLLDVFHTFKKGHRIMVQVQSTWFPLLDRNPQKYVDNIYKAAAEDFVTASHCVWHSPDHPSHIEFRKMEVNQGTGSR